MLRYMVRKTRSEEEMSLFSGKRRKKYIVQKNPNL